MDGNNLNPSQTKIPNIPYMDIFNIPNSTKLANYLIQQNSLWPQMLTKISLDIPKLEEHVGEDTSNNIMPFHLLCSSNSIFND
jgi:hypothetical protein